jgi:hypothetical protein
MNQNEKFVAIWHLYESEHGHKPSRMADAVAWGVQRNLLKEPPPLSGLKLLERRMAQAIGQEYDTSKGRRYRVNHAVRSSGRHGQQQTLWGMMGYAPADFLVRGFGQRRDQIVGECSQLDTDVDVFKDFYPDHADQFELKLDFGDDVAERKGR